MILLHVLSSFLMGVTVIFLTFLGGLLVEEIVSGYIYSMQRTLIVAIFVGGIATAYYLFWGV